MLAFLSHDWRLLTCTCTCHVWYKPTSQQGLKQELCGSCGHDTVHLCKAVDTAMAERLVTIALPTATCPVVSCRV